MAETVRAQGRPLRALKLKANHGPLFACVVKAFAAADATGGLAFSRAVRERTRACASGEEPASSPPRPPRRPFPVSPPSAASNPSGRPRRQDRSTGVHYAALSKALNPRALSANQCERIGASRTTCHWPLDVVFHEDDARTRKNYAPQNLAVLRRMALDILRTHPDNKIHCSAK